MGSAVLARDPDIVMQMFKTHNKPFFSIIEGKNEILYRWDEDDQNGAEEKLREFLDYIVQSRSMAQFTIRIYDDGERITNKKEYIGTIPFKFDDLARKANELLFPANNNGTIAAVPAGTADSTTLAIMQALHQVAQTNQLILERLTQPQEEEEEEEPEEETEEPEQNPQVQVMDRTEKLMIAGTNFVTAAQPLVTTLVPLLGQIFGNIFKGVNINQPAGNVGTTTIPMANNQQQLTNEDVQQAIGKIIDTIGEPEFRRVMVALGKMAQENPAQLQMLITMVK